MNMEYDAEQSGALDLIEYGFKFGVLLSSWETGEFINLSEEYGYIKM